MHSVCTSTSTTIYFINYLELGTLVLFDEHTIVLPVQRGRHGLQPTITMNNVDTEIQRLKAGNVFAFALFALIGLDRIQQVTDPWPRLNRSSNTLVLVSWLSKNYGR